MATTLALRNTTNNGISVAGSIYYDMVTTFGSAIDTSVTDTAASGTEIQLTDETTNDIEVVWVSGRAPAGGFTLTSVDLSIWARESNMNANVGLRARFFERTPEGTETEIGGGPFNDGAELGTADAEMTWTANVTDTTIEENNRLVLKLYLTNVGTMGGGHTATISFNAASAATGDSFITLAETVTFKLEPQVVSVDQVTETDLAQAITALKTRAIGQVTETDSAQAITAPKIRPVNQALESDLAQAILWAPKHRLIDQALETDLAQGTTRLKSAAVGLATEANTSQAMTAQKTKAVGQALEADLSQSVAWAPKHRLVVQTTETDLAQAHTAHKTKAVGQATEADLSQGILVNPQTRLVSQASETDVAQAVSRLKSVTMGQATEADLSQVITSRKLKELGFATETDIAQALASGGQTVAVGQAAETDLSQTVTWSPKHRAVNQAAESNVAQSVAASKLRGVGMVSESDLAQAITTHKRVQLGLGTESDTALGVAAGKIAALNQAIESSLAQSINRVKSRLLQQALESDVANSIVPAAGQVVIIGQSIEVDVALGITLVIPYKIMTTMGFSDKQIRTMSAGTLASLVLKQGSASSWTLRLRGPNG